MLLQNEKKIKLFSVFNNCSETTIPLENAVNLDENIFEKHILSFYQGQDELERLIEKAYQGKSLTLHGLSGSGYPFCNILNSAKLLVRVKPDIVHVHHCFSGLVLSILSSIFSKARVVTTIHSDYGFYSGVQKFFFLLTYMLSDMIICNSNNTKKSIDRIRKLFFSRIQTAVIYNGVDIRKIKTAVNSADTFVSSGYFTAGTVGRLVPAKDYKTLLEAFAEFNKITPDTQLKIVGDGPLRGELEQMSKALGIGAKVEFCGFLPRQKVYERLRHFDVFIVSSKWEGFCNAAVEAMIARIPVLAAKIDTLLEVLGCDNGIFFSPSDAGDLCQKMNDCYSSYEHIRELADKAHNFACERYSLEKSSGLYEQAYRTILGK